jgi:hypothetical protein
MSQSPLNIGFRQAFTGLRASRWLHLCIQLMSVQMTQQPNAFKWGRTKSVSFSVKSVYLDYMDDHTQFLRKYIWKIKVPLKIRILFGSCIKKFFKKIFSKKWQGS